MFVANIHALLQLQLPYLTLCSGSHVFESEVVQIPIYSLVPIVELPEWPQSSAHQSLYYIMIEFHTNMESQDQTSQLPSIYPIQYAPWMVQCNGSKRIYQRFLERFSLRSMNFSTMQGIICVQMPTMEYSEVY